MEALVAIIIAVLVGSGVYLVLRARTFPVILGLTLLSYGANLFVFISGRLKLDQVAVVGQSADPTDPLPQALVLTAIVIGFAMTAFLVVLALRAQGELGSDHVDGQRDALDGEQQDEQQNKGSR
ncbi:NADH-ubiquinone/plastoquinone oxidoreductase chain 4L superfamily [Alloalcanivorax dieselolei B5]|uniref:NADH-ubiquinone/plastoquinone oxidoreductase chain 4L superfamily n=1 Tax=Alcanivorax dieselolei (strain DSM 16502 / CGMCC 1.3690 / MCCC 1A00001 / B-5) TaxID=930169 RepID=K0CG82_ALCDB|nr:Na+/H+ antiporter subunit C [Alloalcanivorax dieselolei]AFT72554.1 NADH-ubiquinone/plastoquinone oxidoreductase chain 4L superfamily [Alloalcanivorax dieselolei B5]GGJ78703.1 Na+/H+ antiporter subunit C [Alloalcanivorax dieselolei]